MTDFVIVVALATALAAPVPGGAPAPAAPQVPLNAPTVGFNVYRDAGSCEQAAAHVAPRPGTRLVCLPVVPYEQELASAY
jgi:hypothetical protein